MKYISLFSGIEAATVAWQTLGWEPVAYAEIEPFPKAVLKHHYPNVPDLGDMTKVNWKEYHHAADVVVGGSPCQAFSIAGLRKALDCSRRTPVSSDNPSKETCRMVDDRDGRRCVRCGRSLYAVNGSRHHRKLRSQCTRVEKHQVQNLILLCGSGTTGCHGFVHMHPTIAYENGWCVKSFQDQLEVPVRTWHGLVYLTTDGKYSSTKEQSK